MKNLFTSKKSLENVSIPSVQKIKNELYNEVDETQKTEVSEDSFVDSGIKVLKTTDYNKLRLRKDNRPLDFKHVQLLVNSFKENGVIIMPGIINADNEIIDGQHRAKLLKKYFTNPESEDFEVVVIEKECNNESEIIQLFKIINTTRSIQWKEDPVLVANKYIDVLLKE